MEQDELKQNIKKTAKRIGKKFLKTILLPIIIIAIILVILAGAVKVILQIDAAGNSNGKANVTKAADNIMAGVVGTKTTASSSSSKANEVVATSDTAKIIIEKAIECHKYVRENGYTYGGGYNIPEGIFEHNIVDCSAYVSWVFYCAGYESFKGYQELDIVENFEKHDLIEVPIEDAMPGDIIHEPGHIEIVAEVRDGKITRVYNCGSDQAIQSEGTNELPESSPDYGGADHIYRVKSLGLGGQYTTQGLKINIAKNIIENGRGGYKVNFDLNEKANELINNSGADVVQDLSKYTSSGNRLECVKSMLNAAIVTIYPDLRNKAEIGNEVPNSEVQGIIKLKRKKKEMSENAEGEYLQYISMEQYNDLKKNNSKDIFDYFTIDNSGQILIAGYERKTVEPQKVDYGGDPHPDNVNDFSEKSVDKMTDVRINYIQQVEKYAMSFDLLWTLLVYSNDENFIIDLAKSVLNSEIVITVCDNVTEKDVEDVYTYVKNVKINENATLYDTTEEKPRISNKYSDDKKNETKYMYKITNKSHYEYNNPSIAITYADTWAMKYEATVKKSSKDNTNKTNNEEKADNQYKEYFAENVSDFDSLENMSKWKADFENKLNEAYKNEIEENQKKIEEQEEKKNAEKQKSQSWIQEFIQSSMQKALEQIAKFDLKYNIKDGKLKYLERLTDKKRTVTTKTKEIKYELQPGKNEGKFGKDTNENSFASVLIRNPKAKKALEDAREWMFEAIEAQESICDMEDMLKYLFQEVYNIYLGVNEEDFSFDEYGKNPYTIVGNFDILVEFVGRQENSRLWEYLYGSGFYNEMYVSTHVSQDKQYFYMRPDDYRSESNNSRLEGNRNYGFGLLIYAGSFGYNNEAYFSKYGNYDLRSYETYVNQLLTNKISLSEFDEKTKVKVDDAMNIMQCVVQDKIDYVKGYINDYLRGYNIPQNQIHALVDIAYQYGNISGFDDAYKNSYNNGVFDYDGFFARFKGFHTDSSTGEYRATARKALFKEGKYSYQALNGSYVQIQGKTN